jgi:hypothetical protein
MMKNNRQLGSILILTLLMLLFLQFVAITVVNSTNISSMIVRNFQIKKQLEATAYKAVIEVINNKDYFLHYTMYLNKRGNFESVLNASIPDEISAKIMSLKCIDMTSFDANVNCDISHQYWQLIIQVQDIKSKATMRINYGISLTLLPQIQIKTVSWYQHHKNQS